MPSLKDIAKLTAIAKVAYGKVYDLLEDDAKISDTIEKAEAMLKKFWVDVDPEVKLKAQERLKKWFDDDEIKEIDNLFD